MKNILVTGATGNVGMEVVKALSAAKHQFNITAAVRDLETDYEKLSNFPVKLTEFDYTNITTYKAALKNCDILFLLRPPQISEVKKYFKPLINAAKEAHIKHIVFLSVQGVENSKFIPHYKIEKLIRESNIAYTFLRPAYFMQNFTTTLRAELIYQKKVFLPAGRAKFTLIDVRDIGTVAAKILLETSVHQGKAYDLTNNEKLTFKEMAEKISILTGKNIQFQSPSPLSFFLKKRKEGVPVMFILVMIMLHYFPRFQKEPPLSEWVEEITGNQPISFDQFVKDNLALLT